MNLNILIVQMVNAKKTKHKHSTDRKAAYVWNIDFDVLVVSELILKEKFSSEVCPSSKVMPELSSGDSVLGDSNSSARSSGSGED